MTRRPVLLLLCAALLSGCAAGRSVTGYFSYANPPRLVGTWVDSALATSTDTIAWVLGPRGLDKTLSVHVGPAAESASGRTETVAGYGYWYVRGGLASVDTGHICFRSRARGRDACFAYELSMALAPTAAAPQRRRLLIVAYEGRRHTRDRVLLER